MNCGVEIVTPAVTKTKFHMLWDLDKFRDRNFSLSLSLIQIFEINFINTAGVTRD
jgi:hypothetical protein